MEHYRTPIFANPNLCDGGAIPDQGVGSALAQTFNYFRCYHQFDMLASHAGHPLSDYNGGTVNKFFVISPVEDPADAAQTTRKIGMVARRWNYDFYVDPGGTPDTYNNDVEWNASQLDDHEVTIRNQYIYTGTGDQTNKTPPMGPEYVWIADATQDTGDSQYDSGYRWDTLEADGCSFATFAAFSLPEWTLTDAASMGIVPGNFAATSTVRGFNGAGNTGTSLGALVNYIDGDDGVLQNTKKCIAQWCHPRGSYIVGAGGNEWLGFYERSGAPVKVYARGRNLRGRTFPVAGAGDNCDFVMVGRWDADVEVRVRSYKPNDTLIDTYTVGLGADPGSSALHVAADALKYYPSGGYFTVEFEVSSAKAMRLRSFAIYEKGTGEEV